MGCCESVDRPRPRESLDKENPNAELANGNTQLADAAQNLSLVDVKLLIAVGADPNLAGESRVLPLVAAAYNADMAMVEYLLKHGAKGDVRGCNIALDAPHQHYRNRNFYTALEAACDISPGDLGTAVDVRAYCEKLLVAGAVVTPENVGISLYIRSVFGGGRSSGDVQVVDFLLSIGMNPSATNASVYDQTPVQHCLNNGNRKMLKLLLSHGGTFKRTGAAMDEAMFTEMLNQLPSTNPDGLQMLKDIVGDEAAFEVLLASDTIVVALCSKLYAKSLAACIKTYKLNVVRVANEHGTLVSPLVNAVQSLDSVEVLLKYASLEEWIALTPSNNPIDAAAKQGSEDVVEHFLQLSQKASSKSSSAAPLFSEKVLGEALMSYLCSYARGMGRTMKLVRLLAESGADCGATDSQGRDAIDIILGPEPNYAILDAAGNAEDTFEAMGEDQAQLATDVLGFLCSSKAKKPLALASRISRHGAVFLAVKRDNIECAKAFVAFGADVNSDEGGMTALEAACESGKVSSVKAVLALGGTPTKKCALLCPRQAVKDITHLLRKAAKKPRAAASAGNVALFSSKNAKQIQAAVDLGADIDAVNPETCTTAITQALDDNKDDLAVALAAAGASLSTKDELGRTPVMCLAASTTHVRSAAGLLGKLIAAASSVPGHAVLVLDSVDATGGTALHIAANFAGKRAALEKTDDPSQSWSYHGAVRSETAEEKNKLDKVELASAELVAVLLEQGANANIQDAKAETPLIAAAKNGNTPVLRALLTHHRECGGVELTLTDADGSTALNAVCAQDSSDGPVLELLDSCHEQLQDVLGVGEVAPLYKYLEQQRCSVEVVKRFVELGADLLGADDKRMHRRRNRGAQNVLEALLSGEVAQCHIDIFKYITTSVDAAAAPKVSISLLDAVQNNYRIMPAAMMELTRLVVGLLPPGSVTAGADSIIQNTISHATSGDDGLAFTLLDRVEGNFPTSIMRAVMASKDAHALIVKMRQRYPADTLPSEVVLVQMGLEGAGRDAGFTDAHAIALLDEAATPSQAELDDLLMEATNGHVPLTGYLLGRGANPDAKNTLNHAIITNNSTQKVAIVRLLLEHKASPNKCNTTGWGQDTTPLEDVFAGLRSAEASNQLGSYGNDYMPEPTARDIIGLLLAHGADPFMEEHSVVRRLQTDKKVRWAEMLVECVPANLGSIRKRTGDAVESINAQLGTVPEQLYNSCKNGDLKTALQLAEQASKEELRTAVDGDYPIQHVVGKSNADRLLEVMLKRGADPDVLIKPAGHAASATGSSTPQPCTALALAFSTNSHLVGHGRVQLPSHVHLLLKYGADPNTPHNNGTPLIFSVKSTEVLRSFIEFGADVSSPRAADGATPLMQLIVNFTTEVYGTDFSGALVPIVQLTHLAVMDSSGRTAFHLAAAAQKEILLRSLVDAASGTVPWSVLHCYRLESGNSSSLSVGIVKRLIDSGADVDRLWRSSDTTTIPPADSGVFMWLLHPLCYEVQQGVAALMVRYMSPETLHAAVMEMKYAGQGSNSWSQNHFFHSASAFTSRRAWMVRELRWKQWRVLLFLQRHGPPHLQRLLAVDDIMYEVFDALFSRAIELPEDAAQEHARNEWEW